MGEDAWLVPEFGFWSWPEPGVGSYTGYRQKANAVEAKIGGWSGKIQKLFWRGALWIGEERKVRFPVYRTSFQSADDSEMISGPCRYHKRCQMG